MKKYLSWHVMGVFLLAFLSFFSFLFDLATAQQQAAGVVTGLQGQAQLTRPAVAPTALKFKDGVVIRDVIDTREKSLARILFGGRSTVTVRELTRLEVREELLPGGGRRDVHDLSSKGFEGPRRLFLGRAKFLGVAATSICQVNSHVKMSGW